jgi:hypothetical protein
MRLTVDNAPVHFRHLVTTITGATFEEGRTAVIGDTRVERRISHAGGIHLLYSFTLSVLEDGPTTPGEEPTYKTKVIATRTTYLPYQGGNSSNITSSVVSAECVLDMNNLGLQIEECIDALTFQADMIRTAVTGEVAYV